MPDKNKMRDGLYLGSKHDAYQIHKLEDLNITHVLTIMTDEQFNRFGMKDKYKDTKIVHKHIVAEDSEGFDFETALRESLEFVDQGMKTGNVFVHCIAGIIRSATVCIAYCMRRYKWTYQEAYKHVKYCRPFADPVGSFVMQLQMKEADLMSGKF